MAVNRSLMARIPRLPRPHSTRDWLRTGLLAAVAVSLLLALATRLTAPAPARAPRLTGRPAPSFTLPAEQHGQMLAAPVTVAPGGHPQLLVFFYTLCTHCLLPVQAAAHIEARPPVVGLRVIYINSPGENAPIADLYASRLGITDPILLDNGGKVAARYGVAYYPTFVLVDGTGTVRRVWTGETGEDELRAGIAQALGARKGS